MKHPAPAVAPSATGCESVQELGGRPSEDPNHVGVHRARWLELHGLAASVRPGIAERFSDRPGELVIEVAREGHHWPPRPDAFVHGAVRVVPVRLASKEAVPIVRVFRRRSEALPKVVVADRQAAYVHMRGWIAEEPLDLPRELLADALVGVDLEHPFSSCAVKRDVALRREAEPRLMDDSRPSALRDLDRRVARASVHHDYLVAERDTGEAGGQTRLLVCGDHEGRDGGARRDHRRDASTARLGSVLDQCVMTADATAVDRILAPGRRRHRRALGGGPVRELAPVVLFAGQIRPDKRLELAIEASAQPEREHAPGCRGRGP